MTFLVSLCSSQGQVMVLKNLFLPVPTLSSYCGHLASEVVINMILVLYGAM